VELLPALWQLQVYSCNDCILLCRHLSCITQHKLSGTARYPGLLLAWHIQIPRRSPGAERLRLQLVCQPQGGSLVQLQAQSAQRGAS
jgi:hypothetical protein